MQLTTKAEHRSGRMLFAAFCLAAGLSVWGGSASAQEVSASGAVCSAGAIAGDYSSGFGEIKCQVGGSGLSCCYDKNCRYSLSLTPTADGNVVGRWDHNNGDSGPVSFGLNGNCDLTNGLYSRDPNPPGTKWSVGARTSGGTTAPAPAPEVISTGTTATAATSAPGTSACTAADAAGDYPSSSGTLKCRAGGSGLICAYRTAYTIDLVINAGLGKAVGEWDHNDGKRSGPVEFVISSDCHLATGWWSEDEGTAQKVWTVGAWSAYTDAETDSVVQAGTESATPTPLIQKGDVDPATAIANTETILDGETCDDGNAVDGDGCASDCTLEGFTDADQDGFCLEQGDCNDNNLSINPGASETCDGVDNDCDGAVDNGISCSAVCGDSVVQPPEECDDGGNATFNCDDDCTAPACGDGLTNSSVGETCDDGNAVDGDGCASDCTLEG